jgi:hypothetical protein
MRLFRQSIYTNATRSEVKLMLALPIIDLQANTRLKVCLVACFAWALTEQRFSLVTRKSRFAAILADDSERCIQPTRVRTPIFGQLLRTACQERSAVSISSSRKPGSFALTHCTVHTFYVHGRDIFDGQLALQVLFFTNSCLLECCYSLVAPGPRSSMLHQRSEPRKHESCEKQWH